MAGTGSGFEVEASIARRRRCERFQVAGTTSMLSNGSVTMLPIIGSNCSSNFCRHGSASLRALMERHHGQPQWIPLITFQPRAAPSHVGSSPAMTTASVITFRGREARDFADRGRQSRFPVGLASSKSPSESALLNTPAIQRPNYGTA